MNEAVVVGPLPTHTIALRAPLYEPSNVTEPEPDAAAGALGPELAAVLAAALAGAALTGAALDGAGAAAALVLGAAALDAPVVDAADDVDLLWQAAVVSDSATTPTVATRR
jgi:hypothetical protein